MPSRRSDYRTLRRGDEPMPLARRRRRSAAPELRLVGQHDTEVEVLNGIDMVSRRIDDLARALNCFGYFDDEPDRPRAA